VKTFLPVIGRKIDSSSAPWTHQRFVETVTSILLLCANRDAQRFHTVWPQSSHFFELPNTASDCEPERFGADELQGSILNDRN
jgi:hypothetical protein